MTTDQHLIHLFSQSDRLKDSKTHVCCANEKTCGVIFGCQGPCQLPDICTPVTFQNKTPRNSWDPCDLPPTAAAPYLPSALSRCGSHVVPRPETAPVPRRFLQPGCCWSALRLGSIFNPCSQPLAV